VAHNLYAREAGGLSGAPLQSLANAKLEEVHRALNKQTCLIGAGGINSGSVARTKLSLGATLVQLYTGFIFHGPALVRDCIKATQSTNTTADNK